MIALDNAPTSLKSYPDWLKRTFDLVVAGLASVVLVPAGLVIGILVVLSSKGPALFQQQRVGRNGELFRLFKFRSMRQGDAGPMVTAGGDDRVTPLGRPLRKWKLDELPQIINVLKGEMSLVGPRPEVPHYVAHYTSDQRSVLTVRPGITGLSQLEFRNEEELLAGKPDVHSFYLTEIMPKKLEIDLRYVRDRSLKSDIHILLRTVVAVLRR